MTKRIDGILMEKMLWNALANLKTHEEEINRLNVFPVADGDTGINMRMTLENGLRNVHGVTEVGLYLRGVSSGMMLGARGNSGVILSEIFRGIYQKLSRCHAANIADIRDAFIVGYRTAYQSVVQPVEGTILTVAREGVENVRSRLDRNTPIETFFSLYLNEMRRVLELTPTMLNVLKEYGVVDSGAVGYITIIEGMYKYLVGEVLEVDEEVRRPDKTTSDSLEHFNENSTFKEGYCMEFILQLLKGEDYQQTFDLERYKNNLQKVGNSIVTIKDGYRVKVHVHTLVPSKIIRLSQRYGEFLTFKLENMQVQHNEFVANHQEPLERAEFAVVSVVNGEGIEQVFEELGCRAIINSDKMNASIQEFLDAFKKANADTIVVLPNNKNIIRAAETAASMFEGSRIHVLHTASIVEGYYALAMDIPGEDEEKRIKAMLSGAGNVVTLCQAPASRDYEHNGIGCREGQEIALINDGLVYACEDRIKAVLGGLRRIEGIGNKEVCVIFPGEDVKQEEQDALEEAIMTEYPLLELNFLEGGQKIFSWLIGVI